MSGPKIPHESRNKSNTKLFFPCFSSTNLRHLLTSVHNLLFYTKNTALVERALCITYQIKKRQWWELFKQMMEKIWLEIDRSSSQSSFQTEWDRFRACSVHVFEIFNRYHWNQKGDPQGDDKKLGKVLSKFKKYCSPKNQLIHMSQNSKSCEFGDSSRTHCKCISS